MLDWLSTTPATSEIVPAPDAAARLMVGLLLGGAIAILYRMSHGGENAKAQSLCVTLVLLCALIAMVTMIVGGSVAKAFSLVGALSIVRFRTVVEDTRDTAFVIFSVIVGMGVGSGALLLPAAGVTIIGIAAVMLHRGARFWSPSRGLCELVLRLPTGSSPDELFKTYLANEFKHYRIVAAETTKQGSQIEYHFEVGLHRPDSLGDVIRKLALLDLVQGVELKGMN